MPDHGPSEGKSPPPPPRDGPTGRGRFHPPSWDLGEDLVNLQRLLLGRVTRAEHLSHAPNQVKSSEKIVGKDLPITCEFDTSESLLSINIGNKSGAKMSIGIDLEDVDGPSEVCTSSFGSWLPHALLTIPQGTVELYTADDFVAIFRHTTRDHVLLVMDKRGD